MASKRVLCLAQGAIVQTGYSAPAYLNALEQALDEEPPPYGTLLYADMVHAAARNAQWLAICCMRDIQRASKIASRTWELAERDHIQAERAALDQHALDHLHLGRQFLALLDLCLPGILAPELRSQLESLVPQLPKVAPTSSFALLGSAQGPHSPSVDALVHTNLEALRTIAMHILVGPSLIRLCEPDRIDHAALIVREMLSRMWRNLAVTIRLVENRATSVPILARTICCALHASIRADSEEIIDYSYHLRFTNYP